MRLSFLQKIVALLRAYEVRGKIKSTLVRNYWANWTVHTVDLPGAQVKFHTDDFFSNYLCYQQSGDANFVEEPAVTQITLEHLKNARCFVDVGANLGYFTVIAAKLRPDIPVYAFEMDGTIVPLIERNLRLNQISNATVISAAVGDSDGTVVFTPHPFSFLGMVTGVSTKPFQVTNTAPIVRLDDYFRDKPAKPDLMKVDVDGAEMGVLRGAETLLAQDDLQMLFEVHPRHLPRFHSSTAEVFAYLRDRGFRCFRIIDFRKTDRISLEDVTERPEVLSSLSGDMLFVTKNPSSSVLKSLISP